MTSEITAPVLSADHRSSSCVTEVKLLIEHVSKTNETPAVRRARVEEHNTLRRSRQAEVM